MTTPLTPPASPPEDRAASRPASGRPQPLTRDELMASACEKLGETARRIAELQARLRSLGVVH